MLQKALQERIAREQVRKNDVSCSNLLEIKHKLNEVKIGDEWIVCEKDNELYIMCIKVEPWPQVSCYVKINNNLLMSLHHNDFKIHSF